MLEKTELHESISQTYTRVLRQESEEQTATVQSAITQLADYGDSELSVLPGDAVENSFGCGNPLAFAGVKAGDVVLDLGSGAGIDLLLAAKVVGPEGRVIGVDMTDAMLEHARENIEKAGVTNAEVRKGMIENLPVEDNSVDWVISNCVINLSPDKGKVFSEIARVLKPGGAMQVSDIIMEQGALPEWAPEAFYNACLSGAIDEAKYLRDLASAGLVQERVLERFTYDASTLKGLALGGEVPELSDLLDRMDPKEAEVLLDDLLHQMEGKISSAKIFARKPQVD